jgi:hypothetical protein
MLAHPPRWRDTPGSVRRFLFTIFSYGGERPGNPKPLDAGVHSVAQ